MLRNQFLVVSVIALAGFAAANRHARASGHPVVATSTLFCIDPRFRGDDNVREFRGVINAELARQWFEHARSLGEADAGELWGIQVHGPLVFADPTTRECVANQADAEGLLREESGVWVGSIPAEVGIANYALEWAGVKWTMVMWPLPEERYARGRLMMHECFHRIQDDLNLPAQNPDNSHLDSREGRIWLQMEWRALAEALIRTEPERKGAIEDALMFRLLRRSHFDGAAETERQLELNEGLAEYTGYRLCGLPLEVLPDRVSMRLIDAQGQSGFVRNFAYISGPAYGLLLDAVHPTWRTQVNAGSDLGDMLAGAVGFAPPDAASLASLTAERVNRYDGNSLIDRETERDRQRQERLAGYRARFIAGPVVTLPLGANVSYSFNPNGLEAIDDTQTVYSTTRVIDEWGILEVSAGGALVVRKDGRVVEVRVSAPSDVSNLLQGDGWTLTLHEGWQLVPSERAGDYTARRDE